MSILDIVRDAIDSRGNLAWRHLAVLLCVVSACVPPPCDTQCAASSALPRQSAPERDDPNDRLKVADNTSPEDRPQLPPSSNAEVSSDEPVDLHPCCGLSKEQIQPMFVANLEKLDQCHVQHGAGLDGDLIVSLSIDTAGNVDGAAIRNDHIRRPELSDCLLSIIRSMSFPPATQPTKAAFPFRFHSTPSK